MTLTEFLLARIAEDEAAARQARPELAWDELAFHDLAADDVPHIARHSPARVLAECAAKRRIVEIHSRSLSLDYCETCFSGDYGRLDDPLHEDWPCPTLRALAAIYADHPDYREEWR